MNQKLKFSAFVLGVVLVMATPAFAYGRGECHPGPMAAPEVDPSLAVAGVTFLAGSLVVLRSRLRK